MWGKDFLGAFQNGPLSGRLTGGTTVVAGLARSVFLSICRFSWLKFTKGAKITPFFSGVDFAPFVRLNGLR